MESADIPNLNLQRLEMIQRTRESDALRFEYISRGNEQVVSVKQSKSIFSNCSVEYLDPF